MSRMSSKLQHHLGGGGTWRSGFRNRRAAFGTAVIGGAEVVGAGGAEVEAEDPALSMEMDAPAQRHPGGCQHTEPAGDG